ncbi:hypothetical protein Tco_1495081 [Tanacetum coccineum]
MKNVLTKRRFVKNAIFKLPTLFFKAYHRMCTILSTIILLLKKYEIEFTSQKGETIHEYYLRFAQLINDMNTIGMSMKKLQVNTKFVNNLQPEWSKFVTDVKLAKDMHESNFDQLYAYLR